MRNTFEPAVGPSLTLSPKTPGKMPSRLTMPCTEPPPDTTVAFGLALGTVSPPASVTRKNAASVLKLPVDGLSFTFKIVMLAGTSDGTPYQTGTRASTPDFAPRM